jgi:hypothetical protein
MLPRVYLETTSPSYLAAWPSGNAVRARHQQITKDWWATRRDRYQTYTSQLVLIESGKGDPLAAQERLKFLMGLPVLDARSEANVLASDLIVEGAFPERAEIDAAHVALAAVHAMEYLVTWNCRHIANKAITALIRNVCLRHGWTCPEICTPEQLLKKWKSND